MESNREGRKIVSALAAAAVLAVAPLQLGAGKPAPFRVIVENTEGVQYQAPTFLPTCADAQSFGSKFYSVAFPRHDPCATVTTSTGYQLTDDVGVTVNTTKGLITSVQLHGQDVIGEEGVMHESEVFPITPPVTPSAGGFTLHVHADKAIRRPSGSTAGNATAASRKAVFWLGSPMARPLSGSSVSFQRFA